jgi:hypothetical protein
VVAAEEVEAEVDTGAEPEPLWRSRIARFGRPFDRAVRM